MLAALYYGDEKCRVEEVQNPTCGKEEILLRVEVCGICGSDLRIVKHGNTRIKPPAILGHEIAGIIIEKGKEVKKFSVGERIALGADIPCGSCVYCASGYSNNCNTNLAIGYQYPGGFAEFLKVDKKVWDGGPFARIPESMTFESAALAEPVACALNGLEILPNRNKNSIVIIGAGVLGCIFTELARYMGYKKIFFIDKNLGKLSFVQERGFVADEYLLADDEAERKIIDATNGMKADAVIVACGDILAQKLALRLCGKRGAINLFAGITDKQDVLAFSPDLIHYNEMFLTGSHGSTQRQHALAIRLIREQKVEVEKLITHSFPLTKMDEAFAMASAQDRLKVIVKPHQI